MAWIEAATRQIVNLDRVEYLSVDWTDGELTLWANGESGHPIYTEDSTGGKDQGEKFHKLMKQIAQIARGNAYISQANLMEWVRNDS